MYWNEKMQILEKWAKMKNLLHKDDYLSISRDECDGSYAVYEGNYFVESLLTQGAKTRGKALDQALATFWRMTHMHKNILNWSRIKLELAIMGA